MDNEVRAALAVFGLTDLPKTKDELKKVYRRHAKRTHPDKSGGHGDEKPFRRVQRANEVLIVAVDEADKPCVQVKFGEGNPQFAKVARNKLEGFEPAKDCKYIIALKWFMGLSVQVGNGVWCDVDIPDSFALDGVWIHFV